MIKVVARCVLLSFAWLPGPSVAEPITLKLAFFSSDRSLTYRGAIEPFIKVVNSEAKGLVKSDLYSGGILGKEIASGRIGRCGRHRLRRSRIYPGQVPGQFSARIAGTVARHKRRDSRLYPADRRQRAERIRRILRDWAFDTEPVSIHSRAPINSIDDLKGKKIRVNNMGEGAALEKLGVVPMLMQITQISDAISKGSIDGAAVSISPPSDYGIKRVAVSHYFLETSGAPLALLMNRKRFDSLTRPAQDIIRKYSGSWVAERFIETYKVAVAQVMKQLKSEPNRKLTFPPQLDLDDAHSAYKAFIAEWVAVSPHHRELLELVESDIAILRSSR